MEKCQRSSKDVKKYGALKEQEMERRAQVRELLALVGTTNGGKKRMEFENGDLFSPQSIERDMRSRRRDPTR